MLLIGTLAATAAEPSPDTASQRAMLEGVQKTAARYQDELPDFVCTLMTKRYEDQSGKGKKFKLRDTDEVEFRYVGRLAYRTVLKINNKPAHQETLTGFRSDSVLPVVGFLPDWLLGPGAKTKFKWSRWDAVGDKRAAVFTLQLPPKDSRLPLSNNRGSAMVGLDGAMYVEPVSLMVLRLELQIEIPRDNPAMDVLNSSFDLDYGPVSIAGQEFFLPIRTQVQIKSYLGVISKNETEVVRYQKYSAGTSLTFGESNR